MTDVLADSPLDVCEIPTRLGVATLTKLVFQGTSLLPLWDSLLGEIAQNPLNAAAVMDMSVIAQLLGHKASGLALQSEALNLAQLYRSMSSADKPRIRVLALATPADLGGNTPIEFLIESSDVELYILYVVPGVALPDPLPDHDVAIVIAPASVSTHDPLRDIETATRCWPRRVLNASQKIAELDRDKLHVLLQGIPGLQMPPTSRVSRQQLTDLMLNKIALSECLSSGEFPLIVRPVDSHAGQGLEKLDGPLGLDSYLSNQPEKEFFLSAFVDYRGPDRLFRKYRIVFIDGRPHACHMAIADQWKVWYLNANMTECAEEENFMLTFYEDFAARHGKAFEEIELVLGEYPAQPTNC